MFESAGSLWAIRYAARKTSFAGSDRSPSKMTNPEVRLTDLDVDTFFNAARTWSAEIDFQFSAMIFYSISL
jgi:hypothetical protein